jgi:zinc/manganese transport system substrate-binding protein
MAPILFKGGFMKTIRLAALVVSLVSSLSLAKLNVVTTTQDTGAIAQAIGGEATNVYSIAKGYQDPHFVDAKPSYLLKLRDADMIVVIGLELEVSWLPPLLTSARNPKILPGGAGYVDASEGCEILQKPTEKIDRSMGDIHPFGNPHYWMDPENGRVIARHIARKLSGLDPANQALFEKNLRAFETQLDAKKKEWKPFRGTKVITYHNCFPYFAKAFGLEVVNHIEPNPGVPSSPAHVQKLIEQIKLEQVPLLLIDPYFDERLPKKIAQEGGARLIVFPASVGGAPEIKTYFDLFDHDLGLLHQALSGGKS